MGRVSRRCRRLRLAGDPGGCVAAVWSPRPDARGAADRLPLRQGRRVHHVAVHACRGTPGLVRLAYELPAIKWLAKSADKISIRMTTAAGALARPLSCFSTSNKRPKS